MKGLGTVLLALALVAACAPAGEPTVPYRIGNDAVVEIPASYAVYDGDWAAFIEATTSQDLTSVEREYLEVLGEQGPPLSTAFVMAFRAASRGDSGTEILFITPGGPPIDWASFPEEEWLASGVPAGARQASVEFTSVSGTDAVLLRYFELSAGVGGAQAEGSWVTIIQFNSGSRNYSISATTSRPPNRDLDDVVVGIAESVRSPDGEPG
ncbi:MAG: hypothetical protein ACE5F5_02265 [Acidimicrobiia bacterium]